jgi:hypothetical protein
MPIYTTRHLVSFLLRFRAVGSCSGQLVARGVFFVGA